MTAINPLVTVIMPTYNYAQFIKEAIDSVLNQTYKNLELIIVDNYSEDNTEEIVKSYKDNRIKYTKFRNNGVIAASRNTGIKDSKGEYVAFLDSDDLWLPDKLERQVKFLDEHPAVGLVYARAEQFTAARQSGPIIPSLRRAKDGWVFNDLVKRNFIGILTVLVRRKCLERIGSFDEDPKLKSVEDYELWLRLAKHFPVGFINKVLAKYRVHSTNISGDAIKSLKYWLNVVQKIASSFGLSMSLKKQILSIIHNKLVKEYILLKDYSTAIKEAKTSRHYRESLTGMLYQGILTFNLGPLLSEIIMITRKARKLRNFCHEGTKTQRK